MDQDGGDHAAAFGDRRFQTGADGGTVGMGAKVFVLGDEEQSFQEFGDALAGEGGGFDDFGRAAVFGRHEVLTRQLAVDFVDVGAGEVDFVERHDDRHVGGAGVRDRLFGLGHDAVVGGDDEDDDVGHVGAAGTHGGERLVAGGVDERDRLAVVLDLIRAYMLSDAAAFGQTTFDLRMRSKSKVLP